MSKEMVWSIDMDCFLCEVVLDARSAVGGMLVIWDARVVFVLEL